jgi:hypothetical protein
MTQNERLLAHLQQYGTISPLKARHVYRIERLASRMHDLRRMGHPIAVTQRRDPTGARYAEYSLAR